jgi:hypothetical protein
MFGIISNIDPQHYVYDDDRVSGRTTRIYIYIIDLPINYQSRFLASSSCCGYTTRSSNLIS